ncbi:nucleoside triphosphate pyrophosphohydrolase [Acinetobacter phage vB_AbaM_Konradin]|uniref:dCTP pyrophosphatase n=1 Tax=Acinetobacter phage vB_AbaM_Konradin TaxID=2666257 RepID=A0A650EUL4_9CAUD|nr:nucleoside triphosphate pyrophosphohydrolase [Acinetobacter phage vB_AbaM_Konradin]QGT53807.1 dCTP pyrophosphatase [Acinetobacter phage vB_AbaM_Konradin]
MAHFNQCSHLVDGIDAARQVAEDLRFNGEQYLDTMLDMQNSLQIRLAQDKPEMNQDPRKLDTAGKVVDWMRAQKDSIDDEFRELLTSLGGMSNGENAASSVWKAWRSKNLEMRNTLISDLSPEDQLEIKFEMIDTLHFVLNMLNALGLRSEEIFELYYLKNKENFERQNNGY